MSAAMFEAIAACRVCGNKSLVDILHLGDQPLANALVRPGTDKVKRFPLSTAFCPECSLFQLKETVRKEVLFDHYVWVTGTSKGAREYAALFSRRVAERAGLKADELVFEIASNDGTVLKQFMALGMQVLGIEPAKNIAEIATADGVRTDCAYWDTASADRTVRQYGRPKVVIARNVIPHVSELHAVIKGIAHALPLDGTGVIEFHSGQIIADELHYDSIYHEHLCYFTAHSLGRLLKRYGLHPYAVDVSPISGGSIVLYFS
ncbi:MAG: methyltransferase domain-containing protein, partial [Candidatus Omnitrophica bacterium]|nr:methyltransferase domain-containing protein [Candidatus Omnitrophota bacterium]